MKIIPSEDQEIEAFLQWLKLKHPTIANLTHHSPNEGKRSWFTGKKLKRMGLSRGFPDIAIYYPNKIHSGLFLEFKRSDQRNRQKRPSQDSWLNKLNLNGFYACYVYSTEEAMRITMDYVS